MISHICFLGTPGFSVPVLKSLQATFNSSQISVITMPDKPRGRGSTLKVSPVKAVALSLGLDVYTPVAKNDLTRCIEALNPNIVIVVAYGMILEQSITDRYFCMNIHSSLLPKYRGASPIHTCLLNGDKLTGITLIKMNERMDEGDIVKQSELPIHLTDNLETLTNRLSEMAANECIHFIKNNYVSNNFKLTPQNHDLATYTKKINKADLLIESFDDPISVLTKSEHMPQNLGFTLFIMINASS